MESPKEDPVGQVESPVPLAPASHDPDVFELVFDERELLPHRLSMQDWSLIPRGAKRRPLPPDFRGRRAGKSVEMAKRATHLRSWGAFVVLRMTYRDKCPDPYLASWTARVACVKKMYPSQPTVLEAVAFSNAFAWAPEQWLVRPSRFNLRAMGRMERAIGPNRFLQLLRRRLFQSDMVTRGLAEWSSLFLSADPPLSTVVLACLVQHRDLAQVLREVQHG